MPGFTYGTSSGATLGDQSGGAFATPVPRPATGLTVVDAREAEVDLSWNPSGSATEYAILEAESAGSSPGDYSVVATTTSTEYTVTEKENGERYYYRIQPQNETGAGDLSDEVSAITDVPPTEITDTTADAQGEISLSLAPRDNSADGSIDIYRSTDGSLGSLIASLNPDTTEYTDPVDRDGEQYHYTPRRVTDHVESDGKQSSTVSLLPDEDQPVLGNGVEDEVAVDRETQVSNNGEVQLQIRETGESSWDSSATGFAEATVAYDTLTYNFLGLEDGEEYEVRARTETEHVTGAWTAPVSILTQFPGATNPSVDSISTTSATISGQDNADNETGFRLEREERIEGEWRDRRVVASRGPHSGEGSFEIVDDTPSPSTEYRYRIEAYTEHTSATSSWTAGASTSNVQGVNQTSRPASGWQILITHESGAIHRPRALEARPRQRVNDLPRLEVDVPRDDKWTREGFEDADVVAYRDGERQPVDTLVERSHDGARSTTLVLEGGTVLRETDVQRDVIEEEAHLFVDTLVGEETSFERTVDDPATSVQSDALIATGDSTSELQSQYESDFPADDPRYIEGGELGAHPSGWLWEGELNQQGTEEDILAAYSGSSAAKLTTSQSVSVSFTPLYDIPAEEMAFSVRKYVPDGYHNEIVFTVEGGEFRGDGTEIETLPADFYTSDSAPKWDTRGTGNLSGTFTAGTTYTFRIELGASSAGSNPEYDVDLVNVRDSRHVTEDDLVVQTGIDTYEDAAPIYPESVFEGADVDTARAIRAVRYEVTVSSTSGLRIEVSPDGGSTYPVSGDGTDSVSGEFASTTTSAKPRVTLYTSLGEEIPIGGMPESRVDAYELYGDLEDTPIIVNEPYDASLRRVLQSAADDANSIWWLEWDASTGTYRFEWTQPGIREPLEVSGVADYSYSENSARVVEQARVFGANRSYSEEVTAQHDTEVELSQAPLVVSTEEVRNPDTGAVYESGSDYVPRGTAASIEVLSSGDIADGATIEVSYEYSASGEYTAQGVDSPKSRRFDINVTTSQGCRQVALYLVKNLQDPIIEAEVTLERDALGWSLGRGLTAPGLPGSGHELRDVQEDGARLVGRLESRDRAGEIVEELRRQVEGNTRRV